MDQFTTLSGLIKLQSRAGIALKGMEDGDLIAIYSHALMSVKDRMNAIIEECYWKELPQREGEQ